MEQNDRNHAIRVRRALDELLAILARAALADWNKKRAAHEPKNTDARKPKVS